MATVQSTIETLTAQSPATPVAAVGASPALLDNYDFSSVLTLLTSPTNIVLFIILLYMTYIRLRPTSASQPSVISDEPLVFTYYNPVELSEYDGKRNKRILMGIRGRVYDVTAGSNFYGPGGPYGNFAGRDASRGLSKGSFDEDMITPLDQPMDPLDNMTPEEVKALEDWEEHFKTKYILVGALVEPGQKPTDLK